jgi:hypothetical protein
MSDFDALLLAVMTIACLLAGGVWRGHVTVALRRRPPARPKPPEAAR